MKELIDKYVSEEIQAKVEEKKDLILTVLIIVGVVLLAAGIAYVVYRVMTRNMKEEDTDIDEFEDDEEDFFESEDE